MNVPNKIHILNIKQKSNTDLNIIIHYSIIFGCFELIGTCGAKQYLTIQKGDIIILNYYIKSFHKCKYSSSLYNKNNVIFIKPKETIKIILTIKEHNTFDIVFIGKDKIIELKNTYKATIRS
jgi:hypothetical protein